MSFYRRLFAFFSWLGITVQLPDPLTFVVDLVGLINATVKIIFAIGTQSEMQLPILGLLFCHTKISESTCLCWACFDIISTFQNQV